jgi:hypothetical protein
MEMPTKAFLTTLFSTLMLDEPSVTMIAAHW